MYKTSAAEKDVDNQRLTTMLSEAEKIALATVTVFIVVSIVFFIAGFLCRHHNNIMTLYCQKEKHLAETALPPTPVGDLPHEDSITHHMLQELELKTNVAYENVPVN